MAMLSVAPGVDVDAAHFLEAEVGADGRGGPPVHLEYSGFQAHGAGPLTPAARPPIIPRRVTFDPIMKSSLGRTASAARHKIRGRWKCQSSMMTSANGTRNRCPRDSHG